MRIIYFSQSYGPHDHRFLSALAKSSHEVYYLKLEGHQRATEDRPVPAGIRMPRWAGGRKAFRWRDVPRLAFDLRRVIREVKPDLIHAGPVQTCAFVSILSGFRPVLTMSWGFDLMQDAGRNWWWGSVTRYTLRRSTSFVSDARVTRERAIRYGMDPNRITVFPWGVDLRHFKPRPPLRGRSQPAASRKNARPARRITGQAGQSSFVLFCNRSWEPRYGVEVLAHAFVNVARRDPSMRLILLGAGSRAETIRKILVQGGAIDRVQFGGHVQQANLPGWYRRADLFISPSHVDGSSVSLMEALACGLPALVSDIPANREWVDEGVDGWLFPDGNAEALAEKILTIKTNQRRMTQAGLAARAIAEKKADWSKNFTCLLMAYEGAVQGAVQRG